MTAHYKKMKLIFFALSAACLFCPIMIYFIRAFIMGENKQKLTLGITFTIALILFMVNVAMKSHLRSVIWVLLLGVFSVFKNHISIVWVFAITTFLEELILSPLYRYYKSKLTISKEIDKRIGNEHDS